MWGGVENACAFIKSQIKSSKWIYTSVLFSCEWNTRGSMPLKCTCKKRDWHQLWGQSDQYRNNEKARPAGRNTMKSMMSMCMTEDQYVWKMMEWVWMRGKKMIQIACVCRKTKKDWQPDICQQWHEWHGERGGRASPLSIGCFSVQGEGGCGYKWINVFLFLEPKTLHLRNCFQT